MRILFACGGTAGHINPAVAVANYIRERHPETEMLFVGNPRGMEAKLVPAAGFAFSPVEIMGFQRQLNWFNIRYNFRSVICLAGCWGKARRLIRSFAPDIVVGTGGYVSGPVLLEAHRMGIPTLTHESNAFPGVTTKLLARKVDRVLLSVKEAEAFLPKEQTYTVVGNPVREQVIFADRAKARKKLGIGDQICIVSFGGSLGARAVNNAIAGLLAWEKQRGGFYHIHATGGYEKERFASLLQEKGMSPGDFDVREYISDMPDCLAAADLVISRSGAITLAELEASGTASVLIPSPNVAENHQFHNAMVLQNHDAARVIEEKNLTPALLQSTVEELCAHRETLRNLGENARNLAILDANERIYKEIIALLSK